MKRPELNKLIDPNHALDAFDQLPDLDKTKNILCAAGLAPYKIPLLEWIREELPDYRFLLLNQDDRLKHTNYQLFKSYYGKMARDCAMEYFPMPDKLKVNSVDMNISVPLTAEMVNLLEERPYVAQTARILAEEHPQMGTGYPELCACMLYDFFAYVLEKMHPALVLIWNAFCPHWIILKALCQEKNIPVVHFEFGVLPGTICWELGGQMGESEIAQNPQAFQELPVSEEELAGAAKLWDYLQKSKLNRKEQPKNNAVDVLKSKLRDDRPTILYLGQNDFESGLFPYTEHTQKFHSPVFASSDDAARCLAELAEKNGWNLIYKPHPLITRRKKQWELPDNVIMVDAIDINDVIDMADVCVTILSQSGYISTIRKKATVMLGYTQLRGAGCTYEAFQREDVEPVLLDALENGFTKDQFNAFTAHIARLTKYYLYDDLLENKKYTYANDVHKVISFLRMALANNDQFACMKQIAALPAHSGSQISMAQSIREISRFSEEKQKPVMLFVGHLCYDREVGYLYRLAKRMPEYQWVILTQHYRANYERIYSNERLRELPVSNASELKNIKFFIVPELFTKNANPAGWEMSLSDEMERVLQDHPYVREAAENLRGRHPDMAQGFPEAFASKAYWYLNKVLELLQPSGVMMWNEFHAFHHVLNNVCRERGIAPLYMEFGSIPGTYVIEGRGQMGESWCAQESGQFMELPVTEQEEKQAAQTLEFLYKSRISRRKQPENSLNEKKRVRSILRRGRPIIFYAGQNDFESGFYPYTEHTKTYHSPTFTSSDDAAEFLAGLAEKNDWNLIYKPHPVMTQFTPTHFSHSYAVVAADLDINDAIDMADVVVTVFSQSGYVGLIRRKPVVMLGYTQLRGKGVCYEGFRREDVETAICSALEYGYTPQQQKAFTRHTAQMLRYCLLSDLYTAKKFGCSYGAEIGCAVEFLSSALLGQPLDVLPSCQTDIRELALRARERKITLDELESLIQSSAIKVVSFDVFDTLLCRPVVKPVELFSLVGLRAGLGRDFVQMRIAAERAAGSKRGPDCDAVTLEEIYRCFEELFGLDADTVRRIKQEELAVERQYLRPRQSAKRLFEAARSAGKAVIIVSDMYLSGACISEYLRKNGFDGYDKLYVSCDLMRSKKTGRLYETVLEDCRQAYGAAPQEVLHIGDNLATDVEEAARHGIISIYFPKVMDCWNSCPKLKTISDASQPTMDNGFLIGFAAQRLFDDPYTPFDSGSFSSGKWSVLGTVLYGPLMTAATKWMIERSLQQGTDKIYFLLRDGYLPERLYAEMAPLYENAPGHTALQLSRALMYPFAAQGPGSLLRGNSSYPIGKSMTVEQFITTRLLTVEADEKKEILAIFAESGYAPYDLMTQALSDIWLMSRLEPYFLKNAEIRKKALRDYLVDAIQTSSAPAFFDTGYRGRASLFAKQFLGLDCAEYHILARPEMDLAEQAGCEVDSFVQVSTAQIRRAAILHVFMDDIFSRQEAGISAIAAYENGEPIWEYEERDAYEPGMEELQGEIIDFLRTFCQIFGEDVKLLCFDRYQLYQTLEHFFTHPSSRDAKIFQDLRTPREPAFAGLVRGDYSWWYKAWRRNSLANVEKPKEDKAKKIDGVEPDERYQTVKRILYKLKLLDWAKKIYHRFFGYPWH